MKLIKRFSVWQQLFLLFLLAAILTAQTVNLRVRNLNNIKMCDEFPGASTTTKLIACIGAVPSTGGTADARGIEGTNQAWSSCFFTGVTKPVLLKLGAATYNLQLDCTIPSNFTLDFAQGAIINTDSGIDLTFNGGFVATPSQHFSGAGNVSFVNNTRNPLLIPQYWGAVADGTTLDTTAAFKTVQSGKNVFFPPGNYYVNNLLRRTSADIPTIGGFADGAGAIWPISDQNITLANGATITARTYVAGDDCAGRIFSIYGVSNVTIQGGLLAGNFTGYPTPNAARKIACPDGSNHAIEIGSASNITVKDLKCDLTFGDCYTVGYYGDIAGMTNSTNIKMINITAARSFRNAASCVGWDGGLIEGGEYSGTIGANAPLAGFDFEPNLGLTNLVSRCRNITVKGAIFKDNGASGIQILRQTTERINIVDNIISGNTGGGVTALHGAQFVIDGNSFYHNGTDSNVYLNEVRNVIVSDNNLVSAQNDSSIRILGNGEAISTITRANPGVVTTSSTHDYYDGDIVEIDGAGGMVEINGQTLVVTRVDSTRFSIGINTSAYTVYTTGAVASLGTVNIIAKGNNIFTPDIGVEVLANGYPMHNIKVDGNNIASSTAQGITVTGTIALSSTTSNTISVTNNTLRNVTNGAIKFLNTVGGVITGNVINDVNGGTTASCIYADNTPQIRIQNNSCYDAIHNGIYIDTSNFSITSGNVIDTVGHSGIHSVDNDDLSIVNNLIHNAGQTTTLTYHGIHAATTTRANIQQNKVRGNSAVQMQYSIRCQSGTDTLITHNFLTGGGTTGNLQDTCTTTVTDNLGNQ